MVDIEMLEELSQCSLRVASRKLILGSIIYDVECACAGVEAPQPSRCSALCLAVVVFFPTKDVTFHQNNKTNKKIFRELSPFLSKF